MMKKIVFAGALLALAGCVQVDSYSEVVKAPAPAGLEGYWLMICRISWLLSS